MHLELVETPVIGMLRTFGKAAAFRRNSRCTDFTAQRFRKLDMNATAALLTETMGFRLLGQEQSRFRYEIPAPFARGPFTRGRGRTIDVVCAPAAPEGRVAVGAIHHIAFRTPDDAQQRQWLAQIGGLGYNISPVMDRDLFPLHLLSRARRHSLRNCDGFAGLCRR